MEAWRKVRLIIFYELQEDSKVGVGSLISAVGASS